jgi:peptide deformylase
MALRKIRLEGDDILRKKSKDVTEITERIKILVEDMIETMHENNGAGLAAPQIGILKKIVVIDVGDGPFEMINPEIIEASGESEGYEACLSIPGKTGKVVRPSYVKAKAINIDGEEFIIEGEDFLARAICHELDHLNGQLYVDIAKDIEELG